MDSYGDFEGILKEIKKHFFYQSLVGQCHWGETNNTFDEKKKKKNWITNWPLVIRSDVPNIVILFPTDLTR